MILNNGRYLLRQQKTMNKFNLILSSERSLRFKDLKN
jgi:hypothetical protein